MQAIYIYASPEDLKELLKRVVPLRQPSSARRQVAGYDVRRTFCMCSTAC